MSSKPFSVRPLASEDRVLWKKCADRRGMSLNRWLVQAANSQAELDEAEERERADVIAEREILKKTAFPDQGEKCKHVQKGQYCYQCQGKRW